ncbi:MAG TPA: hypothetical protein VGB85_09980 [Nannocystis sp.]|jgi:hypothetical protein
MNEDTGRADVRASDEAPLSGTGPQQLVKLGVWLACLSLVAVIGCFATTIVTTLYVAGGMALATGLVGLLAAVGGGVGVRSEPGGPRRLDHRAIRHGLLLVLAGFVLGTATAIAMVMAIAANWHS